ncbi:MAG TPA: pyrroline-5-carboxylate reductase [Nitrospirae bacterium]|nr:pyrroline-5-carboxylate reductase [bacterium BMS3Abin09]GBE41815.1 pyrroline-5-carboxylate reductase [bacterium BMS3Bbin09]HDH34075.1 pyrroline-5-carboxylate reductase [Nitrospirota bacterium]HDZ84732.1 pyrroline-5-carboxylate reductase [Nitrospirota bacterium]
MKIGFIGGGNIAEAMIKGMTSQGMKDILVSEPAEERREYLSKSFSIETTNSNKDLVASCRIIILAIKPQNMVPVIDEIKEIVTGEHTVVSIAAGIKLDYLSSRLKTNKLIRVMPNTPALVQEGMSVMSLCECFSDNSIAVVRDILTSIGKVITLPEKYMDAVTALSGSGPAFIALFIEAMIEGAKTIGLNEGDALTLAVQTVLGTSKLLDTGMYPARLREMVTSPGGTTAAGLAVFDEMKFKDTVKAAIIAARNRSEELGRS